MTDLVVLIVDDEAPARRKLKVFLSQLDEVGSIEEAENGPGAVGVIQSQNPDLVFLDIQMPGMNGFEVIQEVGVTEMPPVVFITAYDQFALDAFEVEAVDYLLKPFDEERFRKSFQRAQKRLQGLDMMQPALARLVEKMQLDRSHIKRILVNEAGRHFYISVSDIHYLSSEDKYVRLHTKKSTYLVRDTLSRLESRLDSAQFIRIHRSTIVNTEAIAEMRPSSHGDFVAILNTGTQLPISRRYKDRIFGDKSD